MPGVEGLPDAPRSQYAVLSRRSSMAALSSFEDILDIARTTYFPNTFGKLPNALWHKPQPGKMAGLAGCIRIFRGYTDRNSGKNIR